MNNFGRKLAEKIGINVQGGTVHVGEIRLDNDMSRQEFRNRQALLNLVKTAWVEGVLEKSLHEQIPIVLGLEKRESAVESPWNLNFIKADQEPEPLPVGTPVIEVFDKLGAGGTLLVLGEPGSGKTITLLQLARDLIKRAEDDGSCRIPVVLNLSSWGVGKQNIIQWIVEELNSKYHVPKKVGEQWVNNQELLLLLDGLDEIRDLEKRKACVMELNSFQQAQSTEMVVCCRVQDYGKLDNKLRLQSALMLLPLTPDQIQDYLNRLQSNLTVLKTLLTKDATLKELAKSPLLLNIMVLAYQEIDFVDAPEIIVSSNREKQLFDDYINRIFQGSRIVAYHPIYQSQEKQLYSRNNAMSRLVWIARNMIQHSQTIFLIHNIQFNWINIKLNAFVTYFLLFVVVILIAFTLIAGFLVGINGGGLIGFIITIFMILGAYMMVISFFEEEIKFVQSVKFSWRDFRETLRDWACIGMISGMVFGVFPGLSGSYVFLLVTMSLGLYWGLISGLFLGLIFGLSKADLVHLEVQRKNSYSNQIIQESFVNALIYTLLSGLICGIFPGLIFIFNIKLVSGVIVFFALVGAVVGGLYFGGLACIRHFTLRLIIFFTGCTPWNYSRFLDWASDKLFLQKVGGGYIFIHRSLMEHFAEMDNTPNSGRV